MFCGGSSSVFKRAFWASLFSFSAFLMMTNLLVCLIGFSWRNFFIVRICSIPQPVFLSTIRTSGLLRFVELLMDKTIFLSFLSVFCLFMIMLDGNIVLFLKRS